MATVAASRNNTGTSALSRRITDNVQTFGLIAALFVIVIVFTIATNGIFLGQRNVTNIARQMSITGLLSVGMVLVIVTGNIDLSVGNLAGFVSVVVAVAQSQWWPKILPDQPFITTTLSVVIGLLVGTLVGVVQGLFISRLRIPAFITTLGGLWVLSGLIIAVTQGSTIPANQPLFSVIGQSYISVEAGWAIAALVTIFMFVNTFRSRRRKTKYGFALDSLVWDFGLAAFLSAVVIFVIAWFNGYQGVPVVVLLLAIVAVIVTYISTNTRFGRHAYAIGGNREAARLSGVNIRNRLFLIFVLMGFLAGVSGVALASYVGYGTPGAGAGYELEAIAACILGGTSTLGGEGTILGAMLGALIIASLTNGLQLLGFQTEWQYVVKGFVLILAVLVDVTLRRNRG